MIPHLDLWREQCKHLVLAQRRDMQIKFHFHAPIEICYVQQGAIEVCINDRRATLQAGEMSIALGYDSHCYRTVGDGSEATVLIIPPHLCPEFQAFIKGRCAATPFIRDTTVTARIRDCFAEMHPESANRIKTLGYMNVILGIISENTAFAQAPAERDPHLSSRILMYIHAHYQEEISLSTMATALGYNASYLSRYFKAHFHVGLNRYITLTRLKQCVILLRSREKNVAECAFESGFSSLRTFYRAFYNEFGCSPKDFLARLPQ